MIPPPAPLQVRIVYEATGNRTLLRWVRACRAALRFQHPMPARCGLLWGS